MQTFRMFVTPVELVCRIIKRYFDCNSSTADRLERHRYDLSSIHNAMLSLIHTHSFLTFEYVAASTTSCSRWFESLTYGRIPMASPLSWCVRLPEMSFARTPSRVTLPKASSKYNTLPRLRRYGAASSRTLH